MRTTKKNIIVFSLIGALGISPILSGCGSADASEAMESQVVAQVEDSSQVVSIEDEMVPLYNKPTEGYVLTPQASGTVVYGNETVKIDASNANQGYTMVQYSGDNSKVKVQISKEGKSTYTYTLQKRGAYEVFPFTEGNGNYTIKVFGNVSGSDYTQLFSQSVSVTLSGQFLPFLYPNQYVNFNANSAAVKTGLDVTKGSTTDVESIQKIFDYVVSNISYDNDKAKAVQSGQVSAGYVPDIDKTMSERKGICFDYAAVMVTMLRSQNIPAKLVIGYSKDVYHAWVNVYVEGQGWIDGMIFFNGKNWELMDPTFASTGGKSESIMKYISDDSNYTAKFAY